MSTRKPWSFGSSRQMLRLLIGGRFGTAPEERVEDIRAERRAHAEYVIRRMKIHQDDVVVDLGSGCGFMAEPIARAARRLHCLDISEDFAAVCREETKALANVSVQVIRPGDLAFLAGQGVTKAISHAVFMHLSLFDAVRYFRELKAVLPEGGLLLIDINDLDRIDTATDPAFNSHLGYYGQDRQTVFDLMQWHSASSYVRVARQNGFELVDRKPSRSGAYTELLLSRA